MTPGLKVLVVDDEILVALAAEGVLLDLGHEVTVAGGVGEALAAIEAGLRPDLVILDLQLGDGTGEELIGALRARFPLIPVVISTGYALDAEERARLDPSQGPSVVLKKPWSESRLRAAAAEAMAGAVA